MRSPLHAHRTHPLLLLQLQLRSSEDHSGQRSWLASHRNWHMTRPSSARSTKEKFCLWRWIRALYLARTTRAVHGKLRPPHGAFVLPHLLRVGRRQHLSPSSSPSSQPLPLWRNRSPPIPGPAVRVPLLLFRPKAVRTGGALGAHGLGVVGRGPTLRRQPLLLRWRRLVAPPLVPCCTVRVVQIVPSSPWPWPRPRL